MSRRAAGTSSRYLLRQLHQSMDALDEYLTSDEPSFSGICQRILGRSVNAGIDEPSICDLRMFAASVSLPGAINAVANHKTRKTGLTRMALPVCT